MMNAQLTTIDSSILDNVTGGADGRSTYETIGNWVGGIGGGAAGAAGGAIGRGLWDAGSYLGDKVGNWLYPAPRR